MARKKKKVTMERIVNDSTLKSTCNKRPRAMGVIQKARELSILCGVETCAIIVPEGGEPSSQSQTQVWSDVDQRRKIIDGEGYVRERIRKIQEQQRKAERDSSQREATLLLHDAMSGRRANLGGLTVEQLVGMVWAAEKLIKNIKDNIAYRIGQQQTGVKADDPLPYAATVAKAGWDLDPVACSGGSGNGSYGSVGDVMQVGGMDGGFAWGDPGTWFRPV